MIVRISRQKVVAGWIYVLDSDIEAHRDDDCRIFKIGRATSLTSRIKQLGTAYAYKPIIAYAFPVSNTIESEAELHTIFKDQRLNGEWFRLGYEDLTFLSDYAGNTGYFEDLNGKLLPDPMMPIREDDAIKVAITELESNLSWSKRCKYLPLEPKLDLPVCPFEMEDIWLPGDEDDDDEDEDARYEEYIDECQHQEDYQESEELMAVEAGEDYYDGWGDGISLEITEDQRRLITINRRNI